MEFLFRRSIVVVLVLFCVIHGKSQSVKDAMGAGLPYNIPTPTASNLGQYGLVPISEYTGKAEVCVPIHRMEARGVGLDISLYYDTSGLLINQLPGWTGHGWTLMAGGAISRKVNGIPDELDCRLPSLGFPSFFKNYFQVHPQLEEFLKRKEDIPTGAEFDQCADVFFFHFMGKSGRFWLGTDGEWKVLSDDNLCVVFDIDDESNYIETDFNLIPCNKEKQPKVIKGFTIIDDNGVRYIFGGDKSSIELTMNLGDTYYANKTMYWTASTWMLTSVVDRFGNELYSLHYFRGKFITQVCHADFSESFSNDAPKPSADGFISAPAFAATLNSPVYLWLISSSSGQMVEFKSKSAFDGEIASRVLYPSFYNADGALKVINDLQANASAMQDRPFYYLQDQTEELRPFQANPQANKTLDPLSSMDLQVLDKITISNGRTKVFSCTLNYDKKNRIHLSSIDFLSTSSNKMQTYLFDYFKYDLVPKDYMTRQFDFWGYYNGVDYTSPGSNPPLQANPVFSKYGMLTKLTFPTGGCLSIDYEQNTYSAYVEDKRRFGKCLNSSEITGGLRVSRLACHDKGKLILSKTYKYELSNGLSSGVLHAIPKPTCHWKTEIVPNPNYYSAIGYYYSYSAIGYVTTQRIASLIPLSNSFGSHIGYSQVKEINADNTCTIKNYNDETRVYDDPFVFSVMDTSTWSPYDKYSERGYLYGRLLSETKYSADGTKLAEISYEYTSDALYNQNHYTLATNISRKSFSGGSTCVIGTIYKMYYPKVSLSKQTTKTLMGGDWVTSVRTFTYADRELDFVSSKNKVFKSNVRCLTAEVTKCGGNILRKAYVFPYDDVGTNHKLVSEHYLPVTATRTYYNLRLIKGTKTVYGKSKDHYLPMFDIAFAGSEDAADTIVRYKGYDKYCRLADAIDNNGVRHRFFWDSNDGLEAVVDNGSSQLSVDKSATKASRMFANHAEVFGSDPVNVTTCIYNKRGQIAEIASANGQTTSFKYDDASRLAEVYDNNGRKIQEYTYNHATGAPRSSELYDDTQDLIRRPFGGYVCYPVLEDAETNACKINTLRYWCTRKELEITYTLPLNCSNASLRIYAKYPEYKGMIIGKTLPPGGGVHTCKVDVSAIIDEKTPSSDSGPFQAYKRLVVEIFQSGNMKDSQNVLADNASTPIVE